MTYQEKKKISIRKKLQPQTQTKKGKKRERD